MLLGIVRELVAAEVVYQAAKSCQSAWVRGWVRTGLHGISVNLSGLNVRGGLKAWQGSLQAAATVMLGDPTWP
jgi:hypothetical protein